MIGSKGGISQPSALRSRTNYLSDVCSYTVFSMKWLSHAHEPRKKKVEKVLLAARLTRESSFLFWRTKNIRFKLDKSIRKVVEIVSDQELLFMDIPILFKNKLFVLKIKSVILQFLRGTFIVIPIIV